MKFCYHCGASLMKGAISFCPECGQQLTPGFCDADINSGASKSKDAKHAPLLKPEQLLPAKDQRRRKSRKPSKYSKARGITKNKAHTGGSLFSFLINPKKARKEKSPIKINDDEGGYDGYYDDVLPDDKGNTREWLDPDTIKNVALIIGAAFIIIVLTATMMYLL